jgi:mRNA interferase RelE/StbE
VKSVIFLSPARRAPGKHRAQAERLIAKIEAYAGDPSAFPKVKTLSGGTAKRLRVGDFRVIFEESEDEIIVTDIGPRGSIYD